MSPLPEIENTDELGPAMAALTPRERLFVAELFRPGATGAAAARAAGFGVADSKNSTFARIAYRKRSQPHIVKAIVEECQRQVKSLGPAAITGAREIIANKKHKDRGKMIRFVLDKIDPALMLHEHRHDVSVTIEDHTTAAIENLRWLRELRVPREVLLEQFGYSGLSRYERKLAELDERKGPKLIEHNAAAPGSVPSERRRITDDLGESREGD
jgi:hypothetical protein